MTHKYYCIAPLVCLLFFLSSFTKTELTEWMVVLLCCWEWKWRKIQYKGTWKKPWHPSCGEAWMWCLYWEDCGLHDWIIQRLMYMEALTHALCVCVCVPTHTHTNSVNEYVILQYMTGYFEDPLILSSVFSFSLSLTLSFSSFSRN